MISELRSVITLKGGFKGWMTVDESNAWHEFIRNHPTIQKLIKDEAYMEALKQQLVGNDVVELRTAYVETSTSMDVLFEELYDLGKAWYEENVRPALIRADVTSMEDWVSQLEDRVAELERPATVQDLIRRTVDEFRQPDPSGKPPDDGR